MRKIQKTITRILWILLKILNPFPPYITTLMEVPIVILGTPYYLYIGFKFWNVFIEDPTYAVWGWHHLHLSQLSSFIELFNY
jgi:hypothetical protein